MVFHKHRMMPGHMGGTYDPSNVVLLTVEEHAEAHKKLYEEHGYWQDKLAWHGLSGLKNHGEIHSAVSREANLGRKQSQETLQKKSNTMKKLISEGKLKRPSNKGMPRSEEWRKKVSIAMMGNSHNLGKKYNMIKVEKA